MTWDEANTWATNLVYGGLNGWRLPTFDPDHPNAQQGATLLHEMGYLIFTELEALGRDYPDLSPFINVEHYSDSNPPQWIEPWYWTGTKFDANHAWRFDLSCG